MTLTWAAGVKALLNEIVTAINARAAADGFTPLPGEVKVGEQSRQAALVASGIYVFMPDFEVTDQDTARLDRVDVPVVVVQRSLDTKGTATERLVDLVGLVVDTIRQNPTVNAKCLTALARAGSVEGVDTAQGPFYACTVTIDCQLST